MEKNNKPESPVTIISGDVLTSNDPYVGGWTKPPDDWVEPTIAERLEKDFDDDAEFFVLDGRPCVAWTDLDLAYDYSVAPPREVHPFTVIKGEHVDRETFKARVREIHKL